MRISEIFGYGADNHSAEAWRARELKWCPFRGDSCTKSSKTDPVGVCSLSNGQKAAALCPARFLEKDRIFSDAARLAFGDGVRFGVFPEVRILKIESEAGRQQRKIGKVDYVLGKLDGEIITDFAALEVQAVYFSGGEIRTLLRNYLETRKLEAEDSRRRPDFRSSAQKRLVPQLHLKVPVFRRWGKKFFVVTDSMFFSSMPSFKATTRSNSELTWLTYPIVKTGQDYVMRDPEVIYSEWDEVRNSLREGVPPEPSEIMEELQEKLHSKRRKPRIMSS